MLRSPIDSRSALPSVLRLTQHERILIALFLFTVPLVNPWVRGDGVGYYAFARALLIEHRLDFRKDWVTANTSFRSGRVDASDHILRDQYTATGRLNNHFSIGPAMLWTPFLIAAHLGVKLSHVVGFRVPADGFSTPYRLAMAVGTASYGFLGLLISFRLSRKYVPESCALIATIAVWFASSLPVYMYFNPSWSHAQSAFTFALYLWYWDRTRTERTSGQWIGLGLLAALMMNVYYVSGVFLIIPLLESLDKYVQSLLARNWGEMAKLFARNALFAMTIFVGFAPTFVSKKIIYGSYFNFGYTENWFWSSPAILKVGFSSDHGIFSWTPVLLFATIGLFFLRRQDRTLSFYLAVAFLLYLYFIGCYEAWDGISSFGNRFFVTLTPIFVIGLAALLAALEHAWRKRTAAIFAYWVVAALILWNLGLIFQWGTHLLPARGPISWTDAFYNQFVIVPDRAGRELESYMTRRKILMDEIEKEDVTEPTGDQKAPDTRTAR